MYEHNIINRSIKSAVTESAIERDGFTIGKNIEPAFAEGNMDQARFDLASNVVIEPDSAESNMDQARLDVQMKQAEAYILSNIFENNNSEYSFSSDSSASRMEGDLSLATSTVSVMMDDETDMRTEAIVGAESDNNKAKDIVGDNE